MKLKVRPLTEEARRRAAHVDHVASSPFRVGWSETKYLLEYELEKIGVTSDIIVQLDVTEADIRLDNTLRASARPSSATAAVSVEAKGEPLLFVCGRFPCWKDNVRAIALGLEALRKVDRYGITQSAEQYRGFRALPPGGAIVKGMTLEDAARFLIEHGRSRVINQHYLTVEGVIADPLAADELYRSAAKRLHPDVGGNAEKFAQLTEARDLLRPLLRR